MQPIRLFLAQRHLAVLLLGAALLLKLLVPTGYMIDASGGRLAVIVCPGVVPAPSSVSQSAGGHHQMVGHQAVADHGAPMKHDGSGGHGQVEMPCAFAGLSAAALGAVDPIQLAALIAFVLAVGFAAMVLPAVARPVYLRPPLRGPPAFL
ncbi:hypothetical protein [Sphingomonas dokdonensis]|uniref:DUF2946 domain-containing protein n=1 Tax=Sphingomonas dokdonensis TaxID=344880 RepID=A0A245ZE60_9SPHN|nr:hypothetical protein [Sphingomonas dokdonensis]OWK28041.1 hypothetical protein SPDO_28740 [Sphingomonas dokdonensis]